MRVVDSGLALASELRIKLRVVWTRTPDLGARHVALFEPHPGVAVVERGWTANRLLRRVALYTGRYSRDVRQGELERLVRSGQLYALAREPSTLLVTCSRFRPLRGRLECFVPVASLRREVERVASAFGPRTVGVHVRRGDHALSREESPTAAFGTRMAAELARDPATTFFLCTDSPSDEAALGARFPGRVHARPKCLDRGDEAGARDAVIDLYALARTARILGSHESSFSETAAQIGGIELEVVRG